MIYLFERDQVQCSWIFANDDAKQLTIESQEGDVDVVHNGNQPDGVAEETWEETIRIDDTYRKQNKNHFFK